jgi:hypothetical protein
MSDTNQMTLLAPAMAAPAKRASASIVEAFHRRHGFRQTPAEPVELLASLAEWRAHTGPVHDVGVGNGGLCRQIQGLLPSGPGAATRWVLSDVRGEAAEGMREWQPGTDVDIWHLSALDEWPADAQADAARCSRVVMNPPWSIYRCTTCHWQWPAKGSSKSCEKCNGAGTDLAIEIVRATMARHPGADIWVLHNADWSFQSDRSRFFDARATDIKSHKLRGKDELHGIRVYWLNPDGSRPKQAHNKAAVWFHWVPTDRFIGHRSGIHTWPLVTDGQ